ncbi:AbrB/MazE/SpoVT family DNA-binding domain-containing protein [Levilactobacillus tongjiangensis]|uniref:AbrB/MazE/SpoVT family DNA-binding domain-containing protein n=1 Tax=Levilactobacillus tongjiangensis TaxID=2486023 RepID=A0ABW1SWJ8_9LACO|nr:AbrB/MazE/SpoVT family DNA-binding domain-containing protein [Levilactobacillus tongjiangensis]
MASIEEQIHLAQWGNSKAARIPSKVIKQLDLEDNQELLLTIQNQSIVLTPVKKKPENIHELFAHWQDDGQRETELDWGKPEGNEQPW